MVLWYTSGCLRLLSTMRCAHCGSNVRFTANFSKRTAAKSIIRHRMAQKPAGSVKMRPKEEAPLRAVTDKLMRLLVKRHDALVLTVGTPAGAPRVPAFGNTDLQNMLTSEVIRALQQTPKGKLNDDFVNQAQRLLIQKVYTMPLAESLQACHSFYSKELNMSQYLSIFFSVIDENFDRLSPLPTDITQLFVYIFILGSAPQMLFHKVEEYLLKHLDSFDINDLSVICGGFFRANTRIISQDLLDVIAQKLLRNLESVEPFLLPNFLKMFRHSSYIRVSFYERLADQLLQTKFLSKYKNVNPLMHIAFTYASLTIQHEQMFDHLLSLFEKLVSGQRKVRTKDISKFVWACGTLQSKPKDYREKYQQLVELFRADSEGHSHPESLGELLVGLTYLEIFPEDLLSVCLSTDVASQLIESGSDKEKGMQLLLLHESVKLECPGYTGNLLSQAHMQKLSHHPLVSNDLDKQLRVRVGLAAVLSSLQERLGCDKVNIYCPLPHFSSAVIELRYCSQAGFLSFTPQPGKKFAGDTFTHRAITDNILSTLSQQPSKAFVHSPSTRVAIVVAGNHQQALNSHQVLGHWSTKLRQLTKLGYTVCQVSSEVATELQWSSTSERCQRLSELLSSSLQTEVKL